MYKIKLEEYEFTNNNGVITVKRYGEHWRNYIGDNAVLALLHKIEDLEEGNKKLISSLEEIAHHVSVPIDEPENYENTVYEFIDIAKRALGY
ncbi:hypothetical protein FJQ98_16180 [Lysinibacillus agricola]|uniref:Phage protein n=1 Tax=Lysinibacillus agricola TaxID=2590012 RepID=A0ABX7AM58_9BACI|nr:MULTISPECIES: hypothetical protein [Lysinibacillus]KOS61521.1 hypothetical protein AN161_18200 [Lysinibacillus sp. FJAT-14222]QQP10784.1 hypothetical protein FJQ98_16180 [Lysinibacillus agricola]